MRRCAEAREALSLTSYDAVVLDLGLPDGDGLTLLADLQSSRNRVPVLVLTARDTVQVAGWPVAPDSPSYFRLKNVGTHIRDYYGLSIALNSAAGPLAITVAHEPEIDQLVHTILRGFVFHIGWLIPIFLVITLAIGVLAIRSGLRPLREVSQTASVIGPSATAIRLPRATFRASWCRLSRR